MGNIAKTVEEQISLLQNRGMIINDIEKAKEILLDVGYYRLGFYWFPFELDYPQKHHRTHKFKYGTNFDNAVKLYYFDFNLRNILLKPLSRIEIAFRTKVVYYVSNKYPNSPTWFVDTNVVSNLQARSFEGKVYKQILDKTPVIALHHRHHINDKFAPAWKTLEFMTLGEVVHLYKSIKDENLKLKIANIFGIKKLPTFENYLNLITDLRNTCAHGNVLYDFTPEKSIRKGPAMMKGIGENQNLNGALRVVIYMLSQVSENRSKELINEIDTLINKYGDFTEVNQILNDISGLSQLHRK
ncbi:MAG: Abi family protein [Bacteroidales bacterium]|nr:Abi family protein [Bacteroidales bacterium]